MGHYDDQREAHEEQQEKRLADSRGVSVAEYHQLIVHEQKMREGKELLDRQLREQQLIKYYQENKEPGQ